MKNILIFDTNFGFLSDVEARLLLNEIENIDITVRNKLDSIHEDVESMQPDEIIIFANLLSSLPDWDFGIPVRTYARDAEGIKLSAEKHLQCYGIVRNAEDLITAIENNKLVSVEKKIIETKEVNTQNIPSQNTDYPSSVLQDNQNEQKAQIQTAEHVSTYPPLNQDICSTQPINEDTVKMQQQKIAEQQIANPRFQKNMPQQHIQTQPQQTTEQWSQPIPSQSVPQSQPFPKQRTHENQMDYFTENREAILAALLSGQNPQNKPQQPNQQQAFPTGGTQGFAQEQLHTQNPQQGYTQEQFYRQNPQQGYTHQQSYVQNPQPVYSQQNAFNPSYEVEKDLGNIKKKAKVISTYSAKGGVGKTTLSCELATFLALTANGRGKFKVCIADFNIDFGNVLNTLDFNPRGTCMTHWASNIKDRMRRGETSESINYTQAEIESFLQKKDKDGLYALLAPLTNADSMAITPVEVEVMLRNLIYNGDFDFIICDTGNNTRDATFLALNCSDEVFLILTQSVNAANSNQSFLMTMLPINFDMNKIKIIINMIKPGKAVGATVEEVADSIVNPATRKPFECIAKINDLNDVRNAENVGEPLVYNSSHEFTQNIASVAKHVVGDTFVLPELPKQNLFTELLNKLQKMKR